MDATCPINPVVEAIITVLGLTVMAALTACAVALAVSAVVMLYKLHNSPK